MTVKTPFASIEEFQADVGLFAAVVHGPADGDGSIVDLGDDVSVSSLAKLQSDILATVDGPIAVAQAAAANAVLLAGNVAGAALYYGPVSDFKNAPTGVEPDGTRYIVGTAPTGAFVGYADQIAQKDGGVWKFAVGSAGLAISVQSAGVFFQFDGAAWAPMADGALIGSYATLRAAFVAGIPLSVGARVKLINLADPRANGEFKCIALASAGYTDDGGWTIIDNQSRVWRRDFAALARADWFLPDTSGAADSAFAFNNAHAASLAIVGYGGFELVTDGLYGLSVANAPHVNVADGVTYDAVKSGFFLPGVKHKVVQTSGGGYVPYCGTNYTDGQTFVALMGNEGITGTASNAKVVLPQSRCAVNLDAKGSKKIVIKLPGLSRTTFKIIDQPSEADGTLGIGFWRNDSVAHQVQYATIDGGLTISGPNIAYPVVGMWDSWLFARKFTDALHVSANILCGVMESNCWNGHIGRFIDDFSYIGIAATNNNQNYIGSVYSNGSMVGIPILIHDGAGTSFAAVSPGDIVWAATNSNSAILKCIVVSPGWYDEGGTRHLDALTAVVTSISTSGADIAEVGGAFKYKFKSGAFNGNVYTSDLGGSPTEAEYTNPYYRTRICGACSYLGASTEGLFIGGGQWTKAGEAGVILHGSGAAMSVGGNGGSSFMQFESEGPGFGLLCRMPPGETITNDTWMGTPGITAILSGTPGALTSNVGSDFGVQGAWFFDYVRNSKVSGSLQATHSPNYGSITTRNCYDIDRTEFVVNNSDSSNYFSLYLAGGIDTPGKMLAAYPGAQPSLWSVAAQTGSVAATKVAASKLSRNTSNTLVNGKTQLTPRIAYGYLSLHPTAVGGSWAAGDYLEVVITRLDDTASETATAETVGYFFGKTQLADLVGANIGLDLVIACNVYGDFQVSTILHSAAGTITYNAAIYQKAAFCI